MIDDIDYLLENSDKDMMVLYVDSALRNKLYYPTSSEYTIQFAQPFKNVYGFEVIDGSIANTMYNIDIYNNDIFITTVVKSTVALYPIDTSVEFNHIHKSKTFVIKFNQDVESYIAVGFENNLKTFVDNANQLNINKNYMVFLKDTIDGTNIVKRIRQSEDEYYFFSYDNFKYAVSNINTELIDILKENEFYLDTNTMTVIYYKVYFVDILTYNNIKSSGAYNVIISNYRKELTVGNYDILTVTNDLNDLLNTITIDVEPTTAPPKKEGKMMFSSTNYIVINSAKGKLVESLGFDIYPPAAQTISNYKSYLVGDNYSVFGGVIDPSVTTSVRYQIISPGLINLLGERFCLLRIKELEDHLFGSYSYMNFTPGIGMFKMAAGQGGITNLRFDYTSLVRKPFHPIGKLDKLTLKFETANGNIYDFKGVNHQLMFIIKFLVPSKKEKFTKSILNPNYDPNIIKYMSNNRSIEYKEDSDDEEDDLDDEYYKMYKKELDVMDYSSTSSEEENDSDDSDTSSEEEA